jgi:hypothetical protein
MATKKDMDLLAADTSARVEPSKRMLAGLSSGLARRRRWRLAGAAVTVMVTSFVVLGLVMSKHDGESTFVIDNEWLPVVPLDALAAVPMSPSASFVIDDPLLSVVLGVSPVLVKVAARRAPTAKPKPRAAKASSLDVAVLSVLVEHIDAERRTEGGKRRAAE